MKTLVIIGNGFDLDLGWETSFRDFFQAKHDSFLQYNRLSYIQQMIDGEYWYNLEGYLRQCILEVELSDVIFLNDFWKICSNFMLDYFAQNLPNFKTNHNSCAYHLMKALSNSIIYTFNYTNPFTKENVTEPEIHFVHGKFKGATNGAQMKLGVDTAALQKNDLAKDDLLKPLIKSDTSVPFKRDDIYLIYL